MYISYAPPLKHHNRVAHMNITMHHLKKIPWHSKNQTVQLIKKKIQKNLSSLSLTHTQNVKDQNLPLSQAAERSQEIYLKRVRGICLEFLMVGELDIAGFEAHLGRVCGIIGHHVYSCTLISKLQESLSNTDKIIILACMHKSTSIQQPVSNQFTHTIAGWANDIPF